MVEDNSPRPVSCEINDAGNVHKLSSHTPPHYTQGSKTRRSPDLPSLIIQRVLPPLPTCRPGEKNISHYEYEVKRYALHTSHTTVYSVLQQPDDKAFVWSDPFIRPTSSRISDQGIQTVGSSANWPDGM